MMIVRVLQNYASGGLIQRPLNVCIRAPATRVGLLGPADARAVFAYRA